MKPITILVAEDNEKNLRLIKDLLESQGYKVLQARSGRECMELAREKLPALILMDIQMPDIDGIEATRTLKSEALTSGIPILAVTAMAMKGDRERILAAGCDGYIEKPVRFDELINAVSQWI